MSIDLLHEKIRKLKNPSVIDFGVKADCIPPHLMEEEGNLCAAYTRFCLELMDALKGLVPAVRFSFSAFALLGPDGLTALGELLRKASSLGYYVLLDSPQILSPWDADRIADIVFVSDSPYPCDGLIISPYIGSDAVKPFVSACRDEKKDLFVAVRSANKTASELQDLLTGSRLVHDAAMDMVKRFGDPVFGKCGYSRINALVSAGSPNSLKTLRAKFPRTFLLVDGLDYPSGNAKNCSYAFDRMGYGAVVCAGPSVTAAWREGESVGEDYTTMAVQAAERMKKNITRYITIL